jgi:hypothetical protein
LESQINNGGWSDQLLIYKQKKHKWIRNVDNVLVPVILYCHVQVREGEPPGKTSHRAGSAISFLPSQVNCCLKSHFKSLFTSSKTRRCS